MSERPPRLVRPIPRSTPFALGLFIVCGGCQTGPRDCFGIEAVGDLSVRLVDPTIGPTTYASPGDRLGSVSTEAGLPSCEAFDGVDVGTSIALSDAKLTNTGGPPECSTVRADATLPSGQFLESIRTSGLFSEIVFTGGGGLFKSVSRTGVAGCPGSWVLDFDLSELAEWHPISVGEPLPPEALFDPSEPGGQAPILIGRLFRLAEGASCAALPAGVTSCLDVFLGRFEPAP